jgi:N-acetylmuramoyl-L-alanine amidase
MYPKIGIKLTTSYSYNFSIPKRSKNRIKFIIIHYTGMKAESTAIKRLQDPKSKVSSHYYVKKNGNVLNLVPDLYEAWHAGKSMWKNFKSLNKNSIGIEITNPGHDYGYKSFSSKQITSLKKLLIYLIKKYRINHKYILGHSDISPDRKKDPGEKFPWRELAQNRLAWWHNLDLKKIKKFRKIRLSSKKEEKSFTKNLHKIGYMKISQKRSKKDRLIIKAFQRRFRQDLVNGIVDKECFLISKNLVIS